MKILVVHASAGAGHRKAAEALYHDLKSTADKDVLLADVLDHTSPFYKRTYQKTYTFLVTKLPFLWAFFFALTDHPCLRPLVKWLRRLVNHFNAWPFECCLKEKNFDYILSTHFFPNEVAAFLKNKGAIRSKIISVITDFDVHSLWLADGIDDYTVACEHTKEKLIRLGVSEEKIAITGIPTDKKFSHEPDKDELKNRLQIKKDIFTVLIATGSFGIGPIERIVDGLKDYQVLIVCGNNKALFLRLSQVKSVLVKVYGLVDNMDELMSAADIMITKPGGLSVSEALVKSLPLIFFSAIPGQETNNVKVLHRYGVGREGCSIPEIVQEVKKLDSSKEYFQQARQNARRLAKPTASRDIIKLIS